ncbi:hypothetical protein ACOME3_006386 [Neoechinorhynchus agilis]
MKKILSISLHPGNVHCVMSPVHDCYGKPGLAQADNRLAMLRLVAESHPKISVSDWECKGQKCWTNTLTVLQRFHSKNPNALIKLLIGYDTLYSMIDTNAWPVLDVKSILDCGVSLRWRS